MVLQKVATASVYLCHIQIKIPFKISLTKRCIVGNQFRMDRGVKSNFKKPIKQILDVDL